MRTKFTEKRESEREILRMHEFCETCCYEWSEEKHACRGEWTAYRNLRLKKQVRYVTIKRIDGGEKDE